MASQQLSERVELDLTLIPAHIREDTGNTLFRMFMDAIREQPDRIAEFNALGKAFLERRAREREEA